MRGRNGTWLALVAAALFCLALCPSTWSRAASETEDPPSARQPQAATAQDTISLPPAITDPEIDTDVLQLRLIPLTRDELAATAAAWQTLYKEKTQQVVDQQLIILHAQERGDTGQADRARQAQLALSAEREEIGQHFGSVLDAWEKKGGAAEKIQGYRAYRAAVVVEQTRSADLRTLWDHLQAWLFSADGGLKLLIKLAVFIGGLLVVLALARLIAAWAQRAAHRSPRISRLLEHFLGVAIFWLLVALGLLLLLSLIGINVTPLFAVIGGASFVAAFALQNTLGNLAAGLMIMLNRPFDEGDFVDIGGVAGTVKAVSMMSTTVITPDNQVIIVPNSNVWGNVITNTTTATRRVDMTFGIGYRDDIETAQKVLEDTVRAHPLVLHSPEPLIRVAELAASSVNFIVRPWVMGTDYWTVYWDLTRQIKEALDAHDISIPFPQREVHLHRQSSSPPRK
ncbi:mechanosensitive ion channel family protein [Microbulbifer sp. SAOS-129_SWC]|uniref:mechanosensitive ion channel family protein n=1 Tax=Microbulbifer sp. SAOS-129_SWC TaxID=3145235 RepID=UPI003216C00B